MKEFAQQIYRYFVDNFTVPYFRMLMSQKLRAVQSIATGKLLDIGCGNQPYRKLFKNISQYIGTNSKEYYSKKTFSKLKTDYIVEDGCKLPFNDQEFDVVVNFQVLPVFKDPAAFIKEVWRVLRNQGIFIITTDFLYPIWNAPNDYYRFTRYGLEQLVKRNNFDIVHLDNFGGYWSMRARIKEKYIKDMPAILINRVLNRKKLSSKIFAMILLTLLIPYIILLPIYLNISFLIYHYLDKFFYNPDFTTNYVIILKKK